MGKVTDDGAYLRYPHLHGELLCFTTEDDLWAVRLPEPGAPSERARRLTVDRTRISHPRFCPAGERIAYVSWRSLDPEIHLVSVRGGASRRLTYWGATDTRVRGWTPEGDVLAVASHGEPFAHRAWAYRVPVDSPDGPPAGRPGLLLPGQQTAVGTGVGHRGRRAAGRAPHAAADRDAAARTRELEAVPGRRHGTAVAPGGAAAARPRRAPGLGAARRGPDRLPLRPRGRRQPLLLPPGRHRPAAAHRSRRVLRPARGHRRASGGLPVRGGAVAGRRLRAGGPAPPPRRPHRQPARGPPPLPGARGRACHLAGRRPHRPGGRGRGTRQPVLAHPPRRPGPGSRGRPRGAGAAAHHAGRHRADRLRHRRGGRGRDRDRRAAPRLPPPARLPDRGRTAGAGAGAGRRAVRRAAGRRHARRAAAAGRRARPGGDPGGRRGAPGGRRGRRRHGSRRRGRGGPGARDQRGRAVRQRPGARSGLLARLALAGLGAPGGGPLAVLHPDREGRRTGRRRGGRVPGPGRHGRAVRGRAARLHPRRPLSGVPVLARLRPGLRRAHRRPLLPAGLPPVPGAALLRDALPVRAHPGGAAGRAAGWTRRTGRTARRRTAGLRCWWRRRDSPTA